MNVSIDEKKMFIMERLHISDKLISFQKIFSLEFTSFPRHWLYTTWSPTCKFYQCDFYCINSLLWHRHHRHSKLTYSQSMCSSLLKAAWVIPAFFYMFRMKINVVPSSVYIYSLKTVFDIVWIYICNIASS